MQKTTTVIGIIEEVYLQEIQNKAAGKPSRFETNIKLDVMKVYNYKNVSINLSEFNDPIFAGKKELKNLYNIGDNVKIVCTTRTGRHIKNIEKIEN